MNRLDLKTRCQVIAALVEGNSIAAVCRMTGVAKRTVLKLLADLGAACDDYQDRTLRGLRSKRVQCDEIWSFCYAKDRNVPERLKGEEGVGSVWTWTALDADSKLMLTWFIGARDAGCANRFMLDVAERIDGRVQLTTDGFKAYKWATHLAFPDGSVDYAQLVKVYDGVSDGNPNTKYSPPVCCGARKEPVKGWPDPNHISTSFVERSNLTMRMTVRRFTRLTNAFSKKLDNHAHAVSLHFMFYNFCRKHQSLKGQTPAMAAHVADHVWTIAEVVALLPEKTGRFQKIGSAA
jgi:IS1 family transposase